MDAVVETIIAERERRNWSQKRLASEAGVSAKTISRLEADEPVRPETLVLVLRSLGLPDSGPDTRTGASAIPDRTDEGVSAVDRAPASLDIDTTLQDFPSDCPSPTRRDLFLQGGTVAGSLIFTACSIALCAIWMLGWQEWAREYALWIPPATLAYGFFILLAPLVSSYDTAILVTIRRPPTAPLVNRIVHAVRRVAGSTQVGLEGVRSVDGTYTLCLQMDASPTRHTDILRGLQALGLTTSIHSR